MEFGGKRSSWEEWLLKAKNKLHADGAALGDLKDQTLYLFNRLTGPAAKMATTQVERCQIPTDFLDYLNTIFGDPNKEARAQQLSLNLT